MFTTGGKLTEREREGEGGREMTMDSRQGSSSLRHDAVEFLIISASELRVLPMVKYTALSLLADRFFLSLSSISQSRSRKNQWLLYPLRKSNLQLFALISLWISSKIHTSSPFLSLETLKSIADKHISDEYFTKGDFLEAEILFLETLNFEIGTLTSSTYATIEELLLKLRAVATAGEMVSLEACLDIMDLVYENDQIWRWLFVESPACVAAAAGIVAASFLISVAKQKWEFPLLYWLNFVTGCREMQILAIVEAILELIVNS